VTLHWVPLACPRAISRRLAAALPAAFLLLSMAAAAQVSNDDPRTTSHLVQGSVHGPRSTAHASPAWTDHLVEHLARYPHAEAQDVYKFVHQSVYGPAHAVPGPEGARRYLDEEIAALPPGPPGEPLVDVLGGDPPLGRLNLRPFLAAGGDAGALVDAFVATAAEVKGDAETMRVRLAAAVAVLRDAGRTTAAEALAALAAAQEAQGFPALHHSQAYRAAYAPAYRVVSLPRLPPEISSAASPHDAAATQSVPR
jgi:hypothetical protein